MSLRRHPSVCWLALLACLGGACSGRPLEILAVGELLTIASGQDEPGWITQYGDKVYWSNSAGVAATQGQSKGLVIGAPKSGGSPITLASGQFQPFATAADNTGVYWVSGEGGGGIGLLEHVPLEGGSSTILVMGSAPDMGEVGDIALDDTNVYWGGFSDVWTMPRGGGQPVMVCQFLDGSSPSSIVVDETTVYMNNNVGTLLAVPKTGGTPVTLANQVSQTSSTGRLAVDSNYVYWTDPFAGTVERVAKTGGSVTTIASGQNSPLGIAVSGGNVYWTTAYWTTYMDGSIVKVAASGGVPTTIAWGQQGATEIAVDDTSVYWVTVGASQGALPDGTVMKLTPK